MEFCTSSVKGVLLASKRATCNTLKVPKVVPEDLVVPAFWLSVLKSSISLLKVLKSFTTKSSFEEQSNLGGGNSGGGSFAAQTPFP